MLRYTCVVFLAMVTVILLVTIPAASRPHPAPVGPPAPDSEQDQIAENRMGRNCRRVSFTARNLGNRLRREPFRAKYFGNPPGGRVARITKRRQMKERPKLKIFREVTMHVKRRYPAKHVPLRKYSNNYVYEMKSMFTDS